MYLEQEIAQQPEVVDTLLAEQISLTKQVAQSIKAFNPTFVCIAARGTSDNAARYAQYLFGHYAKLPVMLATPSLHTIYDSPPNLARALVIGISQSGQAEDVRQVLSDAKSQGALTVSITNYQDSPMAKTADFHLCLMAGEEVSIAATKTYTAQLTVIAMLLSELTQNADIRREIATLPDYITETLFMSEGINAWADRYRFMERFAVIGRGFNYCTAFEISLKVKELSYIVSNSYSEADFRHGPIATVGSGFPVLIIAPQGRVFPKLLDLTEKLKERGAECLVISNEAKILELADKSMPIPKVPEWLSPIVTIIPGQIFAMQQALVRGYAVDKPRGLSKVTVTE